MTAEPYPILPQGYGRGDVIALASEIGPKIGLSSAATLVLTKLIGSTDKRDWTDATREPIFYGQQDTLAARLGLSARQLRTHEARFIRLGLIERRTLANGGRNFRTGLGLILTPLIDRFLDFLSIRDDSRASAKRMKQLTALRSVRKAEIKEQLVRLSEPDRNTPAILSIARRFAAWPRADSLLPMGEGRLSRHVEEATALCAELAEWIDNQSDSSCEPVQNFRSYIQEDNNQILSVPCNAAENEPRVAEGGEPDPTPRNGAGVEQEIEERRRGERDALQGLFEGRHGLSHTISLASDAFRFEVAARSDRGLSYAFIDAAAARLVELGISDDAWVEACHFMGRGRAATCVLILDANLDHPTKPVRNPGGALRGMTNADRTKSLNLIGSLMGLHRRRYDYGTGKSFPRSDAWDGATVR